MKKLMMVMMILVSFGAQADDFNYGVDRDFDYGVNSSQTDNRADVYGNQR